MKTCLPVRHERGSATIEAAIGVPAFMLFVLLIIAGGRIAIAHQAVQAAAADAARAASLARTSSVAHRTGSVAAARSLVNQQLACQRGSALTERGTSCVQSGHTHPGTWSHAAVMLALPRMA